MTNQLQLFPILDAYSQLQGYITDPDLTVRVMKVEQEVWIHIEPSPTICNDEYLWEQADCYTDDITEWFSHLRVSMIEKDSDWFIIRVRS